MYTGSSPADTISISSKTLVCVHFSSSVPPSLLMLVDPVSVLNLLSLPASTSSKWLADRFLTRHALAPSTSAAAVDESDDILTRDLGFFLLKFSSELIRYRNRSFLLFEIKAYCQTSTSAWIGGSEDSYTALPFLPPILSDTSSHCAGVNLICDVWMT